MSTSGTATYAADLTYEPVGNMFYEDSITYPITMAIPQSGAFATFLWNPESDPTTTWTAVSDPSSTWTSVSDPTTTWTKVEYPD